jgi:pimeloyl-ACP methyl ester carboxylesterase
MFVRKTNFTLREMPTAALRHGPEQLRKTAGPIIFISGFHAHGTIREYVDHLLRQRPDGRVRQFSCRDDIETIVEHLKGIDGPVTLVGNSLGAASAAEVAVRSGRVQTLLTLAPVGSLQADFRTIAASVSAWINLKTPAGLADFTALALSQGRIGPWGYGPEPYATRFIDSPLGHAEFWPQMDAVAAIGFGV